MVYRHIIETTSLELNFTDEEVALYQNSELSILFKNKLSTIIDEVFTSFSNKKVFPGDVCMIERLELDLGVIAYAHLHEELEVRLRERLKEALEEYSVSPRRERGDTGCSVDNQETDFEKLKYFLIYGVLPWNSNSLSTATIEDILKKVLLSHALLFRNYLKHSSNCQHLLLRLIRQLSDALLSDTVVSLFFTTDGRPVRLRQLIEEKVSSRVISANDGKKFREVIWSYLFNQLIKNNLPLPVWSRFIQMLDAEIDSLNRSAYKNDADNIFPSSVEDMRDRLIMAMKDGGCDEFTSLWTELIKRAPETLKQLIFEHGLDNGGWSRLCSVLPLFMLKEISKLLSPESIGYINLLNVLFSLNQKNTQVMTDSQFWVSTLTYLTKNGGGDLNKHHYLAILLGSGGDDSFINNIKIIKHSLKELSDISSGYEIYDKESVIKIIDDIDSSGYLTFFNTKDMELENKKIRLISIVSGREIDKDRKYWGFILSNDPGFLVNTLKDQLSLVKNIKIFSKVVDRIMLRDIVNLVAPSSMHNFLFIEKYFNTLSSGVGYVSVNTRQHIFNELLLRYLFVHKKISSTLKICIDIFMAMLSDHYDRSYSALLKVVISKMNRDSHHKEDVSSILNVCIELLNESNNTVMRPSRFSYCKNIKMLPHIFNAVENGGGYPPNIDNYVKVSHQFIKRYIPKHLLRQSLDAENDYIYAGYLEKNEFELSNSVDVKNELFYNDGLLSNHFIHKPDFFIGYDIDNDLRSEISYVNGKEFNDSFSLMIETLVDNHPMLFLRFYRDLQSGGVDFDSVTSKLSVLALNTLIRSVFSVTNVSDVSGVDFLQAMDAFSLRSKNKRDYYSQVLWHLISDRVIDFEKLVLSISMSDEDGGNVNDFYKISSDADENYALINKTELLISEFIFLIKSGGASKINVVDMIKLSEDIYENNLCILKEYILNKTSGIQIGNQVFEVLESIRNSKFSVSGLRSLVHSVFLAINPTDINGLLQRIDKFSRRIVNKRKYYIDIFEFLVRDETIIFDESFKSNVVNYGNDIGFYEKYYDSGVINCYVDKKKSLLDEFIFIIEKDSVEEIDSNRFIEVTEWLIKNDSIKLRRYLIDALPDDNAGWALSILLPDRLLCRLLYILQRISCETILTYSETMTTACYGLSSDVSSVTLRQEMWRFIFNFIFVKGFLFNKDRFIREYFLCLEESLGRRNRASFSSEILQVLILNIGGSGPKIYQEISKAINNSMDMVRTIPSPLVEEYEKTHVDVERDDGNIENIYIINAGQVLVSPYLSRLFEMLGLMKNFKFKDSAAAERGVHILQYLVDENCDAPEYQLVLNKILCGVKTGIPIVRSVSISESERTLVNSLLEGMIQNWKAIGNTSVLGFRQSFLQREGRLQRNEKGWYLLVQARSYDMLLDQLPWSFSLIKQPWMETVIHVEWR